MSRKDSITIADYNNMGKNAQTYSNETTDNNKHNKNTNSNKSSNDGAAKSAQDVAALREKFGLQDAGLGDLKKKGGKFSSSNIYGDLISHKESQKKGNPRAGIYNDAETGAIYATDGTYIGSISAEDGRNNKAINAHWESMGTGLNSEKTVAFGSGKEGNELNSHHNIAEAVQHAYDEGKNKNTNPSFNEAEFSPQVQEAISRVKARKEYILSGDEAKSIFGHWYQDGGKGKDVSNIDPAQGSDSGSDRAVDQASASFMDNEDYQLNLRNRRAQSEAAQA